ncbi:MAG: fatty acid desaturase [Victivallaceae bacterium]|jgi:omega-6 fatty acid desaturase (delta-12 desaturase)
MAMDTGAAPEKMTIQALRKTLLHYTKPDLRKAILQMISAIIPYLGLWVILVFMVKQKYPFVLICLLIILASLFLVRIFIFFHDCAHNSFFASTRANTILGYVTGVLTFTPFRYWQHNHLVHHNTYADLDHRGVGDIWTLTVEEYRTASRMKRLGYRLYRNPFVFLGIGPGYSFLLTQRLLHQWEGRNERFSAAVTNAAILVIIVAIGQTIGLKTYLLIQLPIILIGGAVGVWLFYVQHQFEGVYWSRHENWDPVAAALKGSSYYKLPKVLQWFSGNIGLHHVHHVLPRIPNYKLQQSYDESPIMQAVPAMTLGKSLKSLFLNLWDEKQQKLVSFKSLNVTSVANKQN